MVKKEMSTVSHRARWRYGVSAACVGVTMLLLLLFFRGAMAQGLAAPLAPTAITIGKSSVTSIVETNNTIGQAVAGELVTVTVVYTVSGETVYNVLPRVALQDGLYPTGSSPAWSAMYTGTTAVLRGYEGPGNIVARDGALVIFPDQGTIAGTDTITMVVYAVRTQYLYVGTAEIGNNQNLRIQGILRYCADAPGCSTTTAVNNDDTTAQVNTVQPSLNVTYTPAPVYLDAAALGAGGGQVRLTFNTLNAAGRPYGHDIVYTATLGVGLTYHSSSSNEGAGAGTIIVVGDTTYIVWQPPSRLGGQSWQGVVTATLPTTFTVGTTFTYAGRVDYETFAGAVPYEGKYFTVGATQTLRPGVSITAKTSAPASGAVTMGDRITYTLTFRQAANTVMQSPYYVDTLPRGFHYVSGTLVYTGTSLLSYEVLEGPVLGTGAAARYLENLRLNMDALPVTNTMRQVAFSYVALNTGLDYRSMPVWDSATNMQAANSTIEGNTTGAMLYWTPPSGSYGNLGGDYATLTTKANSTAVSVIQPFLANAQFAAVRDGAAPVAVGDDVLLIIRLRNSGAAPGTPAHELQVCDTIPQGFEYKQTYSCAAVGGAPACPTYTAPPADSTGKICWTLFGLPRTDAVTKYHELKYQVRVLPTAMPGVYNNYVSIEGYSSQAGVVEGERNYSDFAVAAIPAPVNCGATCITVVGLAADKQAWAAVVAPGDLLTYTLRVTDTRGTTAYTGVVVTDTYDSLLSFVNAEPAATHNSETRQLIWNLGTLSIGEARQMTLTMRVNPVIVGQYVLTNTMTWDSDQSVPFTVAKTTAIAVSALHLRMTGPAVTNAGGSVVYTVVYSNTGSWNNAPVTLTLAYGPYLTYVSASRSPVGGTDMRVFTDTVPNNGNNKTLTITLSTNAPLPYTLEQIHSSVVLASAGAPSRTDDWTMTVQRPVFDFYKTGNAFAPSVGGGINYAFTLRNTGTFTATSLVITDTWDTGTSFQYGDDWTSYGTYAVYTIATLPPGATATVKQLTVQVSSPRDSYLNKADLRSAQTSVQTTTLLIWSPSLGLSKTAYPDPAFPGRVLTYTLAYTNIGGVTISGAVITDTLPSGFTYAEGWRTINGAGCVDPITLNPIDWQFSINAQVVTWRCLSLSVGAVGQLKIWGIVAAAAEATWIENMAESGGAAPIPRRPMDAPLRTLVARPWLRVAKAGAPTHPVAPGDVVTYTLTYENYGSYAAYDVVIKDQLPAQLTFAGCNPACAHNTGLVTWTIGQVPASATGVVTLAATVKAGTHGQTAVNSNYTIENTTIWQKLTPAETQAGAPVQTTILNPQLTLTKASSPTVAQAVNDTIVYTITYANTGGGLLRNVVITDVLDVYTQFYVASAGCVHDGSAAGGVVSCQLGDLLNGESRQIVIQARVLSGLAPGDTILNQVQGRTDEPNTLTSSNVTTVWYQVSGAPEITVAPTSLDRLVSVGAAPFEVAIVISNTGELLLNWTVAESPSVLWLGQSPTGGSLDPGTHTAVMLTFNSAALAVGDYTTILVFSGAGSNTVNVPVTLRVRTPEIAVAPVSFEYTRTVGTAAFTAPLYITNTGALSLTWTVAENPTATWLDQSVASGNLVPGGSATVTLTFNPAGAAGNRSTTLNITSGAGGNTVNVPVKLHVVSYHIFLPLVLRNF